MANATTLVFLLVILTAAVAVVLTPIVLPAGFDGELTGKVFGWKWVRLFSPIVNSYSFLVVLGGGLYSAFLYFRHRDRDEAHHANMNVSLGGLLPGIGGILMRSGYVNLLFMLDFLALAVIYFGYRIWRNSED